MIALLPLMAEANLCDPEKHLTQQHRTEAKRPYEEPYGQDSYRGVHDYNARVIACNRARDSLGRGLENIAPAEYVYPKTMPPRIVRGTIRYFNVAPKRYGYRLERQGGTWILTSVAEFHFPGLKFPDRLDIPMALARQLGIADTVCATTQTKFGGIDRGLVQTPGGWPNACRLNRDEKIDGIPVTHHLMEYWRDTIQRFWSRPGFDVRVKIVNLNEVSAEELDAFGAGVWPIRLNHNKNSRPMYRASPHKPHPLYAGFTGAVIAHEFGHTMGLDDEYPEKKNPADFRDCRALGGDEYAMCVTPPMNWAANRDWAKGVYPWIVTRRYGFGTKTSLEPAESLRSADAGEHTSPPPDEEQTASGEYVAPLPTEDLVSEKARELAQMDPTDPDVETPVSVRQPVGELQNLDRDLSGSSSVESPAFTDPTQQEQGILPGQQQPAGASQPKMSGAAGGRLIAHFPLDGSPSNTVGEDGQIYAERGAPPQTVPGKFGQAYLFEQRSVIAAPVDIDFVSYPQLTITAWVKLYGEDGDGYIVSTGPSSSAPGLRLSNERVRGESAGKRPVLYEGDKVGADSWRFIAGVWNYESHTVRLFNGALAETFPNPDLDVVKQKERKRNQPLATLPGDDEAEPQRYIYIGALNFKGGWFAEDVAIDDVRIYAGDMDDNAIASIRDGGPLRVAGRDQIGETEKNASAGGSPTQGSSGLVRGVPSGVRENLDRLAQSEEFQEATETQRRQRELMEQLESGGNQGSVPGVPSNVQESTERFAQSEEFQKAAESARQQQELMDALESGSSTGTGGGSGGDVDATESGADTPQGGDTGSDTGLATRRQGLKAAGAKLQYGGRVYRIGDISGSRGSYEVTKTFHQQQAILSSLGTTERKDKPCGVDLKGNRLAGGNTASFDIDKCEGGTGGAALDQIPTRRISDASQGIVKLQVCRSGLKADKRVKGVRVTTKRIKDDGSLGVNTQTKVLFERVNCGSWEGHSTCENGTVATGVKVYFADGTQLAPRDYLTGVALMCSQLQPVE
jgi:hypothetical protein